MQLTYYGHSCFSVVVEGKTILFDPFITNNELAKGIVSADKIPADYILLSHGHADHIEDCVEIALRTGAKVVCNWEIHEWLNKQGVSNTHPMNTGGKWNFVGFSVKCTAAQHSSGLPDGSYGGNPMGFIISSESGQLVSRWAKLNFAVLPLGDNFTMDAADAVECAELIACKTIVGVHYDTFGYIKIDHKKAEKLFADAGKTLHLVKIGDTVSL